MYGVIIGIAYFVSLCRCAQSERGKAITNTITELDKLFIKVGTCKYSMRNS